MAKDTFMKVRSSYPKKKDGGSQIALSENDPRHPNGHGFVASPTEFVEVFPTAKVRELLTKGVLIEQGSPEDDEKPVVDMSPAPPAKSEAKGERNGKEKTEPKAVEFEAGDTPDALIKRYSKNDLVNYATENGIEFGEKDSAKTIAEKILSAL